MTTRILMSEGSSLSARESLTALGRAGFDVEVVDANPLCLSRFSRWCKRIHAAPRFAEDPAGYLAAVRALLTREHFDVLYPAHEQAFLFARHGPDLARLTHFALPSFDSMARAQSKVAFASVLAELGLAAPPTCVAWDEVGLRASAQAFAFPFYLKAAFGTATRGCFRIRSAADLEAALRAVRPVLAHGVVLQAPIDGRLGRTQAVFAHGRLVGFHACRQVEEGVGGGDLMKESFDAPFVREDVERLGAHLLWHGALSLDFIEDPSGRPFYIDSNPRLAEPGNALAAGANLPALLVRVSLDDAPAECVVGAPGVRTSMGLQALLRAAKERRSRRAVARALVDLVARRGIFAGATEELTPFDHDARALAPMGLVAATLLVRPQTWELFAKRAVAAYAATPAVIDFVEGRTQ